MDPILHRALQPVLRDIATTGAPTPGFADDDWGIADLQVTAMMWGPGGGSGITVALDSSPAEQIVEAADGVQEFVIEELWGTAPTNWPRCPLHPDKHPMRPAVDADTAVWTCPVGGATVAEIGGLSS